MQIKLIAQSWAVFTLECGISMNLELEMAKRSLTFRSNYECMCNWKIIHSHDRLMSLHSNVLGLTFVNILESITDTLTSCFIKIYTVKPYHIDTLTCIRPHSQTLQAWYFAGTQRISTWIFKLLCQPDTFQVSLPVKLSFKDIMTQINHQWWTKLFFQILLG